MIVTAAIGIAFFSFRAFLGVITMLSAYEAYSGYRALRIRFTGPKAYDALISLAALASAAGFIVYIRSVHFPWSPAVIYPTLGALLGVATYDLVRFAFPKRWFASTWFYEHLIKMLGGIQRCRRCFLRHGLSESLVNRPPLRANEELRATALWSAAACRSFR